MSDCQSASLTISLSVPPPASLFLLSLSLCLSLSLSMSVPCTASGVRAKPSFRMHCQPIRMQKRPQRAIGNGPPATSLLQRRCTFYHNLPSASPEFEAADTGMRHIVCRLLWPGIQVWFACRTRLHRPRPAGVSLSLSLSVRLSVCLSACGNYTCKAPCTQRCSEKLKLFTQDINVVPIYCRTRLRIVTTNCF